MLQGQAPQGLWEGLADQIEAHGFGLRLVSSASAIGGANGLTDYLTREVSVRMDMDDAAQVKTLAHELGHVMLHGPGRPDATVDAAMHRGIAEVEAESVALMVGAAHGLDTTSYTVPYVSSWASSVSGKSPVEVIQSTAERVRGTAVSILDALDTRQIGDGNPPGLDREALASQTHDADRGDTCAPRGGGVGTVSMLRTAAPYRRDDRASLRVPVVMPLVEVTVDQEGYLNVLLEREPYAADGALQREDLEKLLDSIAADLGTPVRVEVHEADGVTFTDIVTPSAPAARPVGQIRPATTSVGEVTGDGFIPDEEVAVAVVVAHQVAGNDGTARLRLPPALLAAHPGLVVLMGQASGTVVTSGMAGGGAA